MNRGVFVLCIALVMLCTLGNPVLTMSINDASNNSSIITENQSQNIAKAEDTVEAQNVQGVLPKQFNTCGNQDCVLLYGCDQTFNPVCGTNGITYRNPCWLDCDRYCQPPPPIAPPLEILHPGPCF